MAGRVAGRRDRLRLLLAQPHEFLEGPAPQGADLVAVCDIDPAKAKAAAEAFGVPHWYTDAEKMFRERNLGLVDIVTRMDTHRRARRDGLPPQGADDRAKAVRAGLG